MRGKGDGVLPESLVSRAYRAKLHAAGLCVKCRRPVEDERAGRQMCAACARAQNERQHKRRARLVAAGICEICGREPARNGSTVCLACGVRRAEYYNAAYAARKKAEL